MIAPTDCASSNSESSSSKWPASILEKSSMSLITVRRFRPEDLTMPRNSRCSVVMWESRANSVIPRMPFMGVRISWLMLARNSLLARLADSAATLASRSSMTCSWSRSSLTRRASSTRLRFQRLRLIATAAMPTAANPTRLPATMMSILQRKPVWYCWSPCWSSSRSRALSTAMCWRIWSINFFPRPEATARQAEPSSLLALRDTTWP